MRRRWASVAQSVLLIIAVLVPSSVSTAQDCTQRPPVRLSTAAIDATRMQVTVLAGAGTIARLTFPGPTQNVRGPIAYQLEIGGQTKVPPYTYVPPSPVSGVQFVLVRPAGTTATVPLVVEDGCGPWNTLVGSGPTVGQPTATPTPLTVSGVTPTPTFTPTMTVTPTPTATSVQAPAGGGSITWSEATLAVSVVPGTSVTRTVSFTSNAALAGADLVLSPNFQPFIQVTAPNLASVAPGASTTVAFDLSAPLGAAVGLRRGTLTVRRAGQPIQAALPIDLNVAQPSAATIPNGLAEPTADRIIVPASGLPYVADQVLIGVTPGTSAARVDQIAASVGGVVVGKYDYLSWYQIRLGTGSPPLLQAIAQLAGTAGVRMAVQSFMMATLGVKTPTDPKFQSWDLPIWVANAWAHKLIKLPEAWDLSTGSKHVTVGILDEGFHWEHEDLKENIDTAHSDRSLPPAIGVIGVWDHGTSVAGIIGANANNNKGYAGVAWDVTMMVRAPTGSQRALRLFTSDVIATNLATLVQDGATIVNMSLEIPYDRDDAAAASTASKAAEPYRQALRKLREDGKDVLLVLGAGNETADVSRTVPALIAGEADFTNVMAVTSVDVCRTAKECEKPKRVGKAAFGAGVTIAAPGELIPAPTSECTLSEYLDKKCETNVYTSNFGGTSAAAPFVAGVAALMQAKAIEIDPKWPLPAVVLKKLLLKGATTGGMFICRGPYSPAGEATQCDATQGIPVLNAHESVKLVMTVRFKRGSIAPGNIEGNGDSRRPSISDDGRYVVFDTRATNLVPQTMGRTDIHSSVLLKNMLTGELEWISDHDHTPPPPPPPPVAAAGPAAMPQESASTVSFKASALSLGARPDLDGDAVQQSGPETEYCSWAATMSGDGRYVAFIEHRWSSPGVESNIVVKDRQAGTFQVYPISRPSLYATQCVAYQRGGQYPYYQTYGVPYLAMSADGSTLAVALYKSQEEYAATTDKGGDYSYYTINRDTGQRTFLNPTFPADSWNPYPVGLGPHSLSADGSRLAITLGVRMGQWLTFSVFIVNTRDGSPPVRVTNNDLTVAHVMAAISPDGQHTTSFAEVRTPYVRPEDGVIIQYDLVGHRHYVDNTVVREGWDDGTVLPTGPNDYFIVPYRFNYLMPLDEHATVTAYRGGVVAGGRRQPVVVQTLPNGAVEPVDVRSDGTPNGCLPPLEDQFTYTGPAPEIAMSRDGRFVVFTAPDMQIVDGDTNGKHDVFVVDRNVPYETPLKAPLGCR